MTAARQPSTKHRLFADSLPDRIGTISLTAAGLLYAAPAYASGSSMPWEQPLQQIRPVRERDQGRGAASKAG
jgi:type IV secretion system protein VirB2